MSDPGSIEKQRQARLDSAIFRAIDAVDEASLRSALANGANPNATRQTDRGPQSASLAVINMKDHEAASAFMGALRDAGAEPLDFSKLHFDADHGVSDEDIQDFLRELDSIKATSKGTRLTGP